MKYLKTISGVASEGPAGPAIARSAMLKGPWRDLPGNFLQYNFLARDPNNLFAGGPENRH